MAFIDSAIIREVRPPVATAPEPGGSQAFGEDDDEGFAQAVASLPPLNGLRELAFDGIISVSHDSSISVTSYPTEAGSDLFDHTYDNPNQIRMVGGISLLADASPLAAWGLIQRLRLERKLLTISTNIGSYSNMILTKCSTIEDKQTQGGLLVSLDFKELLIAGGDGPAGGFSIVPTGPAANRYNTNVHRGFLESLAVGA